MVNKLVFKGCIEEIKLKNDKVLKFTLTHQARGRVKRITATVFNGATTADIYNSVEQLVGSMVTIEGEVYESNYMDKRTGQWVNAYCVQVNKMIGEDRLGDIQSKLAWQVTN